MRWLGLGLVLLAIGLGAFVLRPPEPNAQLIRDAAIVGCGRRPVGRCDLSKTATVTVWVEVSPSVGLALRTGAGPQEVDWQAADTGFRAVTQLHPGDGFLEVLARTKDGRDTVRWTVTAFHRPPAYAEAERIHASNATRAYALLDSIDVSGDLALASEVETVRAKTAFDRQDYEAAVQSHRRSDELARRASLDDHRVWALTAIVFTRLHILGETLGSLEDLALLRAIPSQVARMSSGVQGAQWHMAAGETEAALLALDEAERLAVRLGYPDHVKFAVTLRAETLSQIGRHEAARKALVGYVPRAETCDDGHLLLTRAWLELRDPSRKGDRPESRNWAEAARKRLLECGDPIEARNASVNLAGLHLRSGHPKAALREMKKEASSLRTARIEVRLWSGLIRGQALLALSENAAAQAAFLELRDRAKAVVALGAHWLAEVGMATAAIRSGAVDEGMAAFSRAEAVLDQAKADFVLPSSSPRPSSPEQEQAAAGFASLLLQRGRTNEALEVLERQARRRFSFLYSPARVTALPEAQRRAWNGLVGEYNRVRFELDELLQGRWALSGDAAVAADLSARRMEERLRGLLAQASELIDTAPTPAPLSPLPEGEIALGFHELPDRTIGVARTTDGVRVATLASIPPGEVPQTHPYLAPFSDLLREAQAVQISTSEGLGTIDFHTLPLDGEPLIARARVRYRVYAPDPSGSTERRPELVIVSDPDGTLPAARDEAAWVYARLKDQGAEARKLDGPVSRQRLMAAMDVSHLHWAGHARAPNSRASYLDSLALPLGAEAELSVSDVLRMSIVPERVVLAGCRTALLSSARVGPATAFLAAGASEVVATTRPVSDEDARRLAMELYKGGWPRDLAADLQQAQLRLRDSAVDWAAFRVFVP